MGIKYQGVHRQQLYHWVGRHIDYTDPDDEDSRVKSLCDEQREHYLSDLRNILDSKMGLWMKKTRVPDQIGSGNLVRVRQPLLCFTEWSLSDSQPHAYKYGRLGLGFPRKFVLGLGGQPVSYIAASQNEPNYFADALLAVAAHFHRYQGDDAEVLRKEFLFLTQFVKKLRMEQQDRKARDEARSVKRYGRPAERRAKPTKTYSKQYGKTLEFLEEREWRVVYHDALLRRGRIRENISRPQGPDYFVPVQPGKDLFTVVLPDYRTAQILRTSNNCKDILPRMQLPDHPHVTLLTLEDIGTF